MTYRKSLVLLVVVVFSFVVGPVVAQSKTVETETLIVKKILENGFGCRHNLYAWTMETFKDKLYVGTLNVVGQQIGMQLFLQGLPVLTKGGEIHRGTRAEDGTWTWDRVVSKGLLCKRHFGFRKLFAVGDYLYGVSANHSDGFIVVSTQDGENWEALNEPGFGNKKNTSGRGLIVFQGYLYVGTENRSEGAEIWRHKVEDDGALSTDAEEDWERVVTNGMDDTNVWFSDFLEYNGQLYTGTLNRIKGSQLWRSPDGVEWIVMYDGGLEVFNDQAIMKLTEFEGRMYIGTMNYQEGSSLLVSTNSDSNSTADEFDYIYKNGNDNKMNIYTWYMIEYEGLFYAGTFHAYGQEEFDLYSSPDPVNTDLTVETTNAFCNNNIYGIRSMTIFQDKLIIGSASNNKPTMIFEASAKSVENNIFKNYLD